MKIKDSDIRTISVIYGDNDFPHTFNHLLETIVRALEWRGEELTRNDIDFLIREGFKFHYMAYQMRFREDKKHLKDLDFLVDNFKDIKILFDEEAEFDIENNDHDCGASYVVLLDGIINNY